MTCIVTIFKTKKELREFVEKGGDPKIYDPSIVNERTFMASELAEGEDCIVTNHPKRSWFAKIERKGGKLKVS